MRPKAAWLLSSALDEKLTREVCAEAGVELANLGRPGQLVISGEIEKISKACELAKAKGAKRALALTVAGAYHSQLMASAQSKLASGTGEDKNFCAQRAGALECDGAGPHGDADGNFRAAV